MRFWKLRLWLYRHIKPHYLIIGYYTKEIIGCTCGEQGKADVLAEEPLATFKRVSLKTCPICNEKEASI